METIEGEEQKKEIVVYWINPQEPLIRIDAVIDFLEDAVNENASEHTKKVCSSLQSSFAELKKDVLAKRSNEQSVIQRVIGYFKR